MRQRSVTAVCVLLWGALLACERSPTAPSSAPPPAPSPFAKIVGDYTLTLEIDEKCEEI